MATKGVQLFGTTTVATRARAKLVAVGEELTAPADRLIDAAQASRDAALMEAAAEVEGATLRVRVANWRFIATNDPKGPATFKANVEKTTAAIDKLERAANEATPPLAAPLRAALVAYSATLSD